MSPVRVSMRIGSRHLGDRRFQVARDIDRERLQRRDVERVQPAFAADVAAGGDEAARPGLAALAGRVCGAARSAPPGSAKIRPASCRRRSARSAAPSGRPAPSPEVELMRARRPAAAGEPGANGSGRIAARSSTVMRSARSGHFPLATALAARRVRRLAHSGTGFPHSRECACLGCATTTRPSTGTPFSLRTGVSARCRRQGRRRQAFRAHRLRVGIAQRRQQFHAVALHASRR